MRSSYIVPFGLGFLLVYLGIFGLTGLGIGVSFSLSKLNVLPTYDQFQNLNSWTTSQCSGTATATVQAVGPSDNSSLYLNSGGGGVAEADCQTVAVSTVSQWTCFFSAKLTLGAGSFLMKHVSGAYLVSVLISNAGTVTFDDGSSRSFIVDSLWHPYILQVTVSGSTASAKFFFEGISVGSFNSIVQNGGNPTFSLEAYSGAQAYVDYLELDSGLITAPTQVVSSSPSPSPSPSSSWPSGLEPSPSPSPSPSTSPSPSPSPSVSPSPGTSPNPSPSGNENGTVPSVNFNIDWNAIWKNVNTIVDANREPLLAVGGLLMLFSAIGFLLPPKRLPISF